MPAWGSLGDYERIWWSEGDIDGYINVRTYVPKMTLLYTTL